MSKKGRKKKRRLKLKVVFTTIVFLGLSVIFLYWFLNTPITNIYISGNNILSDEEVIASAKLENYPSVINSNTISLKSNLEDNIYIKKAKIKKKGFFKEIYIEIEENYPLFIYEDELYLYDLKVTEDKLVAPTVTNEVPRYLYKKFVSCMQEIDLDILMRISEIKYDPNDIDEKRFYLTMNDGIYVYLTLNKFERINDYSKIVTTLENKKGILYLDSGEYFEVK